MSKQLNKAFNPHKLSSSTEGNTKDVEPENSIGQLTSNYDNVTYKETFELYEDILINYKYIQDNLYSGNFLKLLIFSTFCIKFCNCKSHLFILKLSF